MRPFQDQEYEAVPIEEKHELDESRDVTTQPRRKRVLAILAFILVVVSSLVVIGFATTWQKVPLASESPVAEEPVVDEKMFLEHAVRAAGDRYLLGTGKGDITGYAIQLYH